MNDQAPEKYAKHLRFDIDGKINLHTGAMLMPNVSRALAAPMMSAHGAEFLEIYHKTRSMLQDIMRTKSTVLITVGTTTLALDWCVASVVEPGEKVLVAVNGRGIFSERTKEIVETYDGKTVVVRSPSDQPLNPIEVENALNDNPEIRTVICPHVESSYGTCNPIGEIGKIVKDHDALFVVDAAPTIGGTEVRVDDWGIDVCVSSSFKGLGAPMGTPIISVSKEAWDKIEKRKSSIRSYHSLLRWRRYFVDAKGKSIEGDPAPSMAVNNVCALHEAVRSIIEDGVEETFRLHNRAARATRLGLRAIGLEVYPKCGTSCVDCKHNGRYCSDALTVIRYPAGVEEETFRRKLSDEYGIIVSGGVGELRGKVFRIGHMGKPQVLPQTVLAAVASIQNVMSEMNAKFRIAEGVAKAQEVFRE